MKMIFSDKSRIYISQGDYAGTFVYCRSNEAYKNVWLKKSKFPLSSNDIGLHIIFNESEVMVTLTSTINAHVYIEIQDDFFLIS